MRLSPLVLFCVLACQGTYAAKTPIPSECVSSVEAETSRLAKLELDGKARGFNSLLELGNGLTLEELDMVLGEELEKSTEADNIWTIMSSSAIFFQDQIPLIKEAIKKKYNNYLKCILIPDRPWWQTEEERHWFLALLYQALGYGEILWNAHQPYLDWKENMGAFFKADNVAFAVSHPEIFETILADPVAINLFIKHDSVNLATHYVKDLNLFIPKLNAMVTAGSIKLLHLLFNQDISLNITSISSNNACRDVDILRLLYVNGYDVKITESILDSFSMEGKLSHLQFFYKVNINSLPSQRGIEKAAEQGQLEAVKWALRSRNLFPEQRVLKQIIKRGDLAVLQVLFEYNQDRKFPCIIIQGAASWGHVNILNWIYGQKPNILHYCNKQLHKIGKVVCKNGKIAGMKWLHDRDSTVPFGVYWLSKAVKRGHLEVLKLAHSINPNSLPVVSALNNAAGKGHLEVLVWAHSKDKKLIPDIDGANQAATNGQIPVLNWLASKVYPNQKGLDRCVELGKVESVCWIMQELPGMEPGSQAILYAAETGRLGVIKHIHKTRPDLLDCPVLLAAAKAKGWDRIVVFLETNEQSFGRDIA